MNKIRGWISKLGSTFTLSKNNLLINQMALMLEVSGLMSLRIIEVVEPLD